MPNLTAVSLFAGVGGFDLALERSGVDVVAAVEIDQHARGVLAHKFPQAELFDDVRNVSGNDVRSAGFVPERGIITGGFPCQDLSVAGKRAGLGGERSGLFWEIVRLADETKARWLILENVPGLLSSNNGRDMGTVIGALVDLGYGVAYRVLDAQFFGVPQRRRRVFIVGCLGDDGRAPAQILAIGESSSRDSASSQSQGQETAGQVADRAGSSNTVSPTLTAYNLDSRSPQSEEQQRIIGAVLDAQGGGQLVGRLGHGCDFDGELQQPADAGQVPDADGPGAWAGVAEVTGTLSPGAHPGGFNGQDAYAGQLVVGQIPQSAINRRLRDMD